MEPWYSPGDAGLGQGGLEEEGRPGKGGLQLESQVRNWGRTSAENVLPRLLEQSAAHTLHAHSMCGGQTRQGLQRPCVQPPSLFHEREMGCPRSPASLHWSSGDSPSYIEIAAGILSGRYNEVKMGGTVVAPLKFLL